MFYCIGIVSNIQSLYQIFLLRISNKVVFYKTIVYVKQQRNYRNGFNIVHTHKLRILQIIVSQHSLRGLNSQLKINWVLGIEFFAVNYYQG